MPSRVNRQLIENCQGAFGMIWSRQRRGKLGIVKCKLITAEESKYLAHMRTLRKVCRKMWPTEISAKPEEPVDCAKYLYGSTIQFPQSEIAATIQCFVCAYARF